MNIKTYYSVTSSIMGNKYLPIGTIVLLKGGTKRLMITGFCSVEEGKERKIWDYSGCIYPEGFLSSNQTALFDHAQIAQIYHMGLIDDEEKEFMTYMQELVANYNENEK